jgi:multiple sugar transport system permease protein
MSVKLTRRLVDFGSYIGILLYFSVAIIPFLWIFLISLKKPFDVIADPAVIIFSPIIDNYKAVLFNDYTSAFVHSVTRTDIPRTFLNSLMIGGGATLLGMVLGNMAAFALAKLPLPRKEEFAFYFLAFRFSPVFAFIIPLFVVYRAIGLYNTYWGMVLAYQIIAIPLNVWTMRSYYQTIPNELFQAGRIDGCSWLDTIRYIAIPLAAPGIAATGVLSFIACWNNFTFPLLLGARETQTVTLATITFIGYEEVAWGLMCAAAMVTIVPELILAVIVQRYIVRGLTYGAVKE